MSKTSLKGYEIVLNYKDIIKHNISFRKARNCIFDSGKLCNLGNKSVTNIWSIKTFCFQTNLYITNFRNLKLSCSTLFVFVTYVSCFKEKLGLTVYF